MSGAVQERPPEPALLGPRGQLRARVGDRDEPRAVAAGGLEEVLLHHLGLERGARLGGDHEQRAVDRHGHDGIGIGRVEHVQRDRRTPRRTPAARGSSRPCRTAPRGRSPAIVSAAHAWICSASRRISPTTGIQPVHRPISAARSGSSLNSVPSPANSLRTASRLTSSSTPSGTAHRLHGLDDGLGGDAELREPRPCPAPRRRTGRCRSPRPRSPIQRSQPSGDAGLDRDAGRDRGRQHLLAVGRRSCCANSSHDGIDTTRTRDALGLQRLARRERDRAPRSRSRSRSRRASPSASAST